MTTRPGKSAEFLRNMNLVPPQAEPANVEQVIESVAAAPAAAAGAKKAEKAEGRKGLKHIGGYLDDQTVEKIALLRARLKLDNSELLKQAIDDLYRKEAAKRAFGDR